MKISEADFEGLWRSAGEWHKYRKDIEPQLIDGRFLPQPGEVISFGWKMVYWFDSLSDRIIAKQYLHDNGWTFQEITDDREFGTWVLLTHYKAFGKGENVRF